MNHPRAILASAVVAAYLWWCLCWFDHDLDLGFVRVSPAIPFVVALGLGAVLAWQRLRAMTFTAERRRDLTIAFGFFAASFLVRAPFLAYAYGLFSSDAGAQGVMALHIGEGRHHPVFLYNWSYVGSLKAHMTALFAAVTGEPVVSFALTAVVIYAAFTASTYLLARSVTGLTESLLAAAYVVIAPGFLTAWGMGNEGNYLDVMLFGTLMLALSSRVLEAKDSRLATVFGIGVLGGLAFWTHILATYYLLVCATALVFHRELGVVAKRVATFAAGFVVGDFPGLIWNASNEWLSFRWWGLDAATLETGDRVQRFGRQMTEVFRTSLSVLSGYWPSDAPPSPPWLWYVALTLVIPAAALVFAYRHRRALERPTPQAMLLAFFGVVIGVFAVSSFGWMTDEPRYLLFLFSVVPIFLATLVVELGKRSRFAALVVALALVGVNLRGDVIYLLEARRSDPVNRRFLSELEALGIRYVRSDYHLSYKYTFMSHGRVVWTSELGPAQTEWYLPFREQAARARDVALVPRSFRFARRIQRRLDARGITYRRKDLLYPVLYDFSEPVKPEELR